jgi:ABC-type transport system involved in multi-copper enzyme maturation permease subunit
MSFYSFYPDPAMAALVMLIYAVVAVIMSMVLFKKKQLTG